MPSFLTDIQPAEVRRRLDQTAYAQAVVDALVGPLPAGCGRQDGDGPLCRVRLVLEALGVLRKGYFSFRGKSGDGRAGIMRLQQAVGIRPDGIWGRATNGAVSAIVQATLGASYDTSATDRPEVSRGGGGGGGGVTPPPPPPPVPEEGDGAGGMLKAGIPILLLGGAIASWLMFRAGRRKGLAGCDCGVGAFDHMSEGHGHDEDHMDEDDLPDGAIDAVRDIPPFPAARREGRRRV